MDINFFLFPSRERKKPARLRDRLGQSLAGAARLGRLGEVQINLKGLEFGKCGFEVGRDVLTVMVPRLCQFEALDASKFFRVSEGSGCGIQKQPGDGNRYLGLQQFGVDVGVRERWFAWHGGISFGRAIQRPQI
jgi:hypothetical protein